MKTHIHTDRNYTSSHILNNRISQIKLNQSAANAVEKQKLVQLLNSYEDIFANDLSEIGQTHVLEYDIEVPFDAKPIRQTNYKFAYKQRDIINSEVQKLLDNGLAEIATDNKWQFPSLLVSKPRSDKKRLCIDFRRLNDITPLHPQTPFDMDHFLCDLGKQNCKYFTILDLKSAYTQVPLSKRSQEICTFSSPMGSIRLKSCPFGLKNLPAIFTKLMDIIFIDIKNEFMTFYLDDLIIFSRNFEDHVTHLTEVFKRLRTSNLTIQPEKTQLFQQSVVFLGIKLSANGIETEDANINKVKNFPLKNTQKSVRSFVGLCSFYRKHIQNFSKICAPLFELTKKQQGRFQLTEEAIESFNILKEKLITAPLLTYPKLGKDDPPLTLTVDSSSIGVGFVLSQLTYSEEIKKHIDKPIFYGSKNFGKTNQKCGSTDLEALGVTIAVKRLHTYLCGRTFNLITDHKALIYLLNKRADELKPSLARKIMFLSQYDFKIFHKEGTKISNADSLSRQKYDTDSNSEDEPHIFAVGNEPRTKPVLDFSDIELESLTVQNIRRAQRKDYLFNSIYHFVKHDVLPTDSRMAKRVTNTHQQYVIHDHILYHIWIQKKGNIQYIQMCMPEQFRTDIMKSLHDLKTVGHASSAKMYQSALHRLWWPGMYSHFENYVASCGTCLEANRGHYPKVALKPLPVPNGVFDTIHLDLLSIQTPSNGYKYILVIIDAFSKLVVAKSLKTKNGKTVASAIYNEWYLKYGIPKQLSYAHHDNGLELVNRWSHTLYEMINVKVKRNTPYMPRSNSQVEIVNKSILSILRKLTKDQPSKWSSMLQYTVMAINSRVNESTGYSPFYLTHGVNMRDIVDVHLPDIPENIAKTKEQAYKFWLDKLSTVRSFAKENIAIAKKIQKRNYDARGTKRNPFSIGDHVYIKVEHWPEQADSKLKNYYKGRYTIVGFQSDTNAILADEKGKHLPRSFYINKLKKCKVRKQIPANKHQQRPNSESSTSSSETEIAYSDVQNDSDRNSNTEHNISEEDESPDGESNSDNCQHNISDQTDTDENSESMSDVDSTSSNNEQPQKSTSDAFIQKPDTQTSEVDNEKIADNFPTDEYFSDENDSKNAAYHPIAKIFRKRILPDRSTQYYVSYKHHPAKKDRVWINESDMSPELQQYARNRKLQIRKANLNMISTCF
ncbi:MAG: reverse transcriptase domain-containing protein [Reichenbachiella sp.]